MAAGPILEGGTLVSHWNSTEYRVVLMAGKSQIDALYEIFLVVKIILSSIWLDGTIFLELRIKLIRAQMWPENINFFDIINCLIPSYKLGVA